MTKKETNEEVVVEKTQTFVVLKEVDEVKGTNRVIYADSISKSEYGTNMVCIKHHKKDGSPCQTDLNTDEISKIYTQEVTDNA